ncbi:MAG: hypothetical protein EG826_10415 [Deltaproteobacteria bacterium]|nr:hypothetical protein [Deltaproteobacteria bacterium]
MAKTIVHKRNPLQVRVKPTKVISYPASADGVDLPDLSFGKNKDEDAFVMLSSTRHCTPLNQIIYERMMAFDDLKLKTLLAPMSPIIAASNITFQIVGRRGPLLKITQDMTNVMVEAHWNLFIPYFEHIKALPIIHPEVLDIFARAVFRYMALAAKHPKVADSQPRSFVVEAYKAQPELLLASLDIFNKPSIYHIQPTRSWLNRISAVNDTYRFQIRVAVRGAVPSGSSELLEDVTEFVHKVVKNYAFRYADYLWTQQYKISFGSPSDAGLVTREGEDIVIHLEPLIDQPLWKPALYLSLGYAIMLAILQAAGRDDKKEYIYLAVQKTWNRFLSFDESVEKQSVRELYGFPPSTEDLQCRSLMECTIGKRRGELVDDFTMLMNYSSKDTIVEKLKILTAIRNGEKTGSYFEQLSRSVRNINASLIRNNINYSKLIEILRNDNIDHLQLTEFLHKGQLGGVTVVDVSEWLSLRTLLYDLINAPKVFSNDYKMLLKVLTKVCKSLIVYVWMLGANNDARYEMVSAYIAKQMYDIFVFNRVKIYDIVADPVECLEAEAVTGYLLNWASLTPEKRHWAINTLAGLTKNVVAHLSVQTPEDVDGLIHVIRASNSGLIGFYLYQAYRWGSIHDELTDRIRSYFPQLLKWAQAAMLPGKANMGGAMLLLVLAQIISDERDGFARNTVIAEEERQLVRDLIKRCVDWDQKHFVMMIAGIAAGYMGNIDEWILQQFDRLLGRYDGGDRVVLRSVVQFNVEHLIERTLLAAGGGDESALVDKIQLLRFGVDPIISNKANEHLKTLAARHGIEVSEIVLNRKNIGELLSTLSGRMTAQISYVSAADSSV